MKVYIASPYTIGNKMVNVATQIDAAEALLNAGHIPFTPLMCHFHEEIYPHSYDTWTRWGIEWLKLCDAIIRLPGESRGADKEVAEAKRNLIPVYFSVNNFLFMHPKGE